MTTTEKPYSCSSCSATWQKTGKTYCWSSEDAKPAMPAACPSGRRADLLETAFDEYRGEGDDAKMARVAAEVEGLCYQPIPGSDAVNPRWTRVEDTIAFAKLMGYRKIGVATCLGLLDEAKRLSDILTAQGFEPESVCCKAGSIDKLELGPRWTHVASATVKQ